MFIFLMLLIFFKLVSGSWHCVMGVVFCWWLLFCFCVLHWFALLNGFLDHVLLLVFALHCSFVCLFVLFVLQRVHGVVCWFILWLFVVIDCCISMKLRYSSYVSVFICLNVWSILCFSFLSGRVLKVFWIMSRFFVSPLSR